MWNDIYKIVVFILPLHSTLLQATSFSSAKIAQLRSLTTIWKPYKNENISHLSSMIYA